MHNLNQSSQSFLLLAAISLAILSPWSVRAEQVAHSRTQKSGKYLYDIQFENARGLVERVKFTLDRGDVLDALRMSPDPDGVRRNLESGNKKIVERSTAALENTYNTMQAQALALLKSHASLLSRDLPGTITVTEEATSITFSSEVKGRFPPEEARRIEAQMDDALADIQDYSKELQGQISTLLEKESQRESASVDLQAEMLRADMLRTGLFREDKARGVIRIDYAEATRRSVTALKDLSRAIAVGGGDERAQTGAALAFMQTIPYDTLKDREIRTQTGFVLPAAAIDINRGDCDTKSVALAATLATLLPRRDVVLVVFDAHAALAIDLPPVPGDETILVGARRYVLLEPAGPAICPVGQVAKATRAMIERGAIHEIVKLSPRR